MAVIKTNSCKLEWINLTPYINMKIAIALLIIVLLLPGCVSRPKNFTYSYDKENTGLDKLIDINGYYISQRECDSTFYSIYMFYSDGLFTIATASKISPELIQCFENGGTSKIYQYPLWGIYKVEDDLIKTQVIRLEGNGCVIFRDYRILPDKQIINISEYVQPEYTNLGYMANYPSFTSNACEKPAEFYSLTSKRDSIECPLLKKKWFRLSR